MFTKIDIKKFGLYKDFTWDTLPTLGRVNIIYGRNYSGKTTLSRVFDAVGQGILHPNYMDGEFTLYGEGCKVDENHLECPYHVRVYNSDFVRWNLSWLNDEKDGDIKAFTLLGEKNVKAQEEIDEINKRLGSVEEKTGMRYDYERRVAAIEDAWKKHNAEVQALDNMLKEKANREIKANVYLVKPGNTYTVANIKSDIDSVTNRVDYGPYTLDESHLLPEAEIERLKRTVEEVDKPAIKYLPETEPNLTKYAEEVQLLVEKKIALTKTLAELVENELLQAWADEGRKVNEGRETCAFCGGPISKERWAALNAHFSKESDELRQQLTNERNKLETASKSLEEYLENHYFKEQNIYAAYMDEYNAVKEKWDAYVAAYKEDIGQLLALIDERQRNLFKPIAFEYESHLSSLIPILKEFNVLIEKNNNYREKLDGEKQFARNRLRLHEVCEFCRLINYAEQQTRLSNEGANLIISSGNVSDLQKDIQALEKQVKDLESGKQDVGVAAKRVSQLLATHFGNASLTLEPEEKKVNVITARSVTFMPDELTEAKQTKFVIKRGGQYAKNLSEGEKSLVSFCYFIAQMEDELNGPEADKLVIFIDDPISSLDNSHIYFVYSLIDSLIARPTKFGQLFISTHNLEFLRLIKNIKLSGPKGTKTRNHYVVVKLGKGNTNDYRCEIRKMPEYLSKYTTEYNFLFKQIYEVAVLNSQEEQDLYGEKFTQYYNIGNNMRKFLECYLFNRYPDTDDPLSGHIAQLFDDNVPSEVNRIVNEYSHLKWADRGMRVLDVPEVVTAAKEIIKALQKKDPEHYETLCRSVGVVV